MMYVCLLSLQPSWSKKGRRKERCVSAVSVFIPNPYIIFGTFNITEICEKINYYLCHLVSENLPELCLILLGSFLHLFDLSIALLGSTVGFVLISVSCSFSCLGVLYFKKQYQLPLTQLWPNFLFGLELPV